MSANPNATTVPTPQMSQIEILVNCVNELARQEKEIMAQRQQLEKHENQLNQLKQKEVKDDSLRDIIRNRLWEHCKKEYENAVRDGHFYAPVTEDVDNGLAQICRSVIEQNYKIDLNKEFNAAWQYWHDKFKKDYEEKLRSKQKMENSFKAPERTSTSEKKVKHYTTIQEIVSRYPELEWILQYS